MKKYWIGCIFLLFLSCETPKEFIEESETLTVKRQPAEYDKQDAVWLIWSPVDHKAGLSNESVQLKLIQAVAPYTKVIVTAANDALFASAKAMIPSELMEQGKVELIRLPSEELWVRDMGPNFVELNNGEKAVVDFGFNAWGYTPSDDMDEATIRMEKYDEVVAEHFGLPLISTDLISEGGNREVNGEGTLMLVETVEQGRNPDMTKAQMESEFQRVLGVKNIIWLKEGLYEDDHTFSGTLTLEDGTQGYTVVTTNGHIDEFARFVNDSTVLLAEVPEEDLNDPIAQENYRRMEENYQILQKATDQDGNPLNIIRMPLPKLITTELKPGDSVYDYISTLEYEDGSIFPVGEPVTAIAAASYLNFLISDKVVIGQMYWKEGMDESIRERDNQVKEILEDLFPDRKVILLDALAINLGGGGIHCITMQEPSI